MTLAKSLLVDPDVRDPDGFRPREAPCHGRLSVVPCLTPGVVDKNTCPRHRLAGLEDVEQESLHRQSEVVVRLRPRHAHRHDAVLGALDSQELCPNERLELAGLPLPPRRLRGLVAAGQSLMAVRARPHVAFGVLDAELDLPRPEDELQLGPPRGNRQARPCC
jgi:hypothetical protein